ncbi:MAG: hypothetical protein JWL90_905 [Chthoniobacteraceae bacterium]|nr:hypothetical protein [Chthoniobacteraceae bacterium]
MEHEIAYIDTMHSLVRSLQTAQHPGTWRIYALIRALVHDIQLELKIGECIRANAHSVQLDNFLSACRAVAFGHPEDSITRAVDCLTMLEGVE